MKPPIRVRTEDSELCPYHLEIVEGLTELNSGFKWLIRIGYALLIFSASFILSVWGIFYPYLNTLSSSIQTIGVSVAVSTHRISTIEKCIERISPSHLPAPAPAPSPSPFPP